MEKRGGQDMKRLGWVLMLAGMIGCQTEGSLPTTSTQVAPTEESGDLVEFEFASAALAQVNAERAQLGVPLATTCTVDFRYRGKTGYLPDDNVLGMTVKRGKGTLSPPDHSLGTLVIVWAPVNLMDKLRDAVMAGGYCT